MTSEKMTGEEIRKAHKEVISLFLAGEFLKGEELLQILIEG